MRDMRRGEATYEGKEAETRHLDAVQLSEQLMCHKDFSNVSV